MNLEIKNSGQIVADGESPMKKWVSLQSLIDLDLYEELIREKGKVEVWAMNPDHVCEEIEILLQRSAVDEY